MERQGRNEDHDEARNDEGEGENQTVATFGFPILDTMQDVIMKNIPPSSLPTFYGKINEDPDTFLFEFNILCRSYNYLTKFSQTKTLSCYTKRFYLEMVHGIRRIHYQDLG